MHLFVNLRIRREVELCFIYVVSHSFTIVDLVVL